MLTWTLDHIALAFFNVVNSRIDAYRILKHKTIAHGINLGAYLVLVGFFIYTQLLRQWPETWAQRWPLVLEAFNFLVSALCQRQLTFDIPLNLRRGLEWFYQSTAEKPKALWDLFERWAFGKLSGKWIAAIYLGLFLICSLIKAFLL